MMKYLELDSISIQYDQAGKGTRDNSLLCVLIDRTQTETDSWHDYYLLKRRA
jgi:hypothetical protein